MRLPTKKVKRLLMNASLLICIVSLLSLVRHNMTPSQVATEGKGEVYKNRLKEAAYDNNVVILAMIDHGFIDVAINFWEISITPFAIQNMLFVSLSKKACQTLVLLNIPCHVYEDFTGGEEDSSFRSPIFLRKMNTRTQFLLDALSWNFTVLNTDTDVIFLKNPLGYFKCADCHLEILEDGKPDLLNAGFVFLRPTAITAQVYKMMAEVARENPESEDQKVLNEVVKEKLKGKIKYKLLDQEKFLCGKNYYEEEKRYFADSAKDCSECVVVHNNWIVSKAAKIYRQKEMLQWVYDGDNYYSDPFRKYLMYDNSEVINPTRDIEEDKEALINAFAIGYILNRTVILPRLLCESDPCPWNSMFFITHLDDSFGGKYRESVFLQHPKVPESIKNGVSKTYVIKAAKYSNIGSSGDSVRIPADELKGATSTEIKEWFTSSNEAVLKLHSLYGVVKGFSDNREKEKFDSLAKSAFIEAVYRQYVTKPPTVKPTVKTLIQGKKHGKILKKKRNGKILNKRKT